MTESFEVLLPLQKTRELYFERPHVLCTMGLVLGTCGFRLFQLLVFFFLYFVSAMYFPSLPNLLLLFFVTSHHADSLHTKHPLCNISS